MAIAHRLRSAARARKMNFWYHDGYVQISLDETTNEYDILDILQLVCLQLKQQDTAVAHFDTDSILTNIPTLTRTSEYLTHLFSPLTAVKQR